MKKISIFRSVPFFEEIERGGEETECMHYCESFFVYEWAMIDN